MLRKIAMVLVVVSALWSAASALGGESATQPLPTAPSSGCVRCHSRTGKGGVVYPEYIRWVTSVHAAKNVGCEACHGGDATAYDIESAHRGMLPPGSADSPVSPRNVPQTCSRCHEAEYQHYAESKHFKRLAEDQRGANCVTCHGSTAVTVPTAESIASTCGICHNPERGIAPGVPALAFRALVHLTEARGQVALASAAVLLARERKQDTASLERNLTRCGESLAVAVREWHSFDLSSIEKATTEAYDLASQSKTLAESGAMGAVVVRGREFFGQTVFLVLLTAAVLLNLLILLRISRHPPK